MTRFRAFALIALSLVYTGGVFAQDPNLATPPAAKQEVKTGKRTLTFDDYKQWERLSQVVISNDGKSLVYSVVKDRKSVV